MTLERIMDNHRGSPRDKVIIRCLDRLNWYGAKPSKLIKIIIINREEMLLFMPLICLEKVRLSCDIIIVFIMNIVVLIR